MIRRYHGNTKIFFQDPYVVRVSYSTEMPLPLIEEQNRLLVRRTYKTINGTWGHSPIVRETVQSGSVELPAVAVAVNGFPVLQNIPANIFILDYAYEYRIYFCFKNELDVLQFRLTVNSGAIRVYMWPNSISFTIHEVIDES